MSGEGTSEREPQVGKIPSRLRKYSKDEFEDHRRLGAGAYGEVRKCYHKDLKMVAIKTFNITGDDEKIINTWNMINREANVLCRLHHENIVEILGIIVWPNAVGIIMEYVDGRNLETLLFKTNQSDLPWDTRLNIAQGVISALSYIHNYDEKKIYCHGDIKPGNILLTKKLVVKLADFGSAALQRATGAPNTTSEITPTKQHTMLYVDPEFLKNIKQSKNSTMDMYSFGSVLYELICTKPPYHGCPANTSLLRELITSGDRPDMKLIDQTEKDVLQTPRDRSVFNLLKDLMLKCWNDDPTSRPESKIVKEKLDSNIKQPQQNTSHPDQKTEWAAAHAMYQEKNVGANSSKDNQHLKCDVTPALTLPQALNSSTLTSPLKKELGFTPSFSNSSKNIWIAANFRSGTPVVSSMPPALTLVKLTHQDESASPPTSSVLQSSLGNDSVSPPNHAQSSKQEISETTTSKPETPTDKFSNDVRQYSKDEFRELYKEDSFIASGGYGDVRKYEHKDKVVAIKKFAVKGDDETVNKIWKMTLREANILCCFHHENIVEILGVTQWDKGVGIVMEYVDGGNLQTLLSKSELSWDTRLEIAKGIVSGLEYIHNYGDKTIFCHGDLRPENILLTKTLQVKLADFDSAAFHRVTGASSTSVHKVPPKQMILVYVAPEFLKDNTLKRNPAMDMYSCKEVYDADSGIKLGERLFHVKSNQFDLSRIVDKFTIKEHHSTCCSFGMVLYELISTKPPYSDCSMDMLVSRLILDKVKPSEEVIEEVGAQLKSDDDRSIFSLLKNLMEKCWNIDSDLRPKSKTVKQELSGDWMNAIKFSNDIRQYSKDEFKVRDKGDSFIGSGGYGDVRKYDHKNKVVAIKEFAVKEDDETTSQIWKIILREANILCCFHHENIVEILGVTQWDKGVGIVMEYVDGGNLQTLLSKSELSWDTRLEIAKGIVSGLEYIHNFGDKTIFCHAAFYDGSTSAPSTRTSHVQATKFTVIYVAPEFLKDNTLKRNPAMDMYSFGMTLYMLICTKPPYSDCDMPMLVSGLILEGIKPSKQLIEEAESQLKSDDDRSIFSLLKNLMEKCWNIDSDLRPKSKTVKQELSGEWMNAIKFSNDIRQYSKDEFKVRNKGDSFIGSGGYGDVRKYDHKNKVVAIKEFAVKEDDETTSQIWKIILREANILCCFHHENIVEILGVTQWDKGVGIVMEYVDGGNLQTLLSKSELSWDTRLEIAKGIVSGLEYIHNFGDKTIFCHAAFYDGSTSAPSTRTSHVQATKFTVIYVAPEFLKDNTLKRNPAMDMYSFGMALYMLICTKPPYSDCSMPGLVPRLILGGIKPTQKLVDEAESHLKSDDDRSIFSLLRNVMERCWNMDRTSRPSSKTVKHTLSGEWMNADKFSKSVRQYSKDEFKVRNKEDSFIGSGGYGDVRKYHHKDQVVAIKEFAVKADEETISQIWMMVLREANILCRFDHENIVKILGVTQWEKGVGIIMEFVDGGNLQTLLNDNQSKLSWHARLDIAKGITSGLEYIHNYGDKETFCHSDLKPANVLLTKELQVKLADFGSAAFYRVTGASTTTISNVSSKQFTLIYVAPEFLQDNTQKRKPTMDMYSFGMVLYELISGKPPYSDCTMPNFLSALILAKVKPSERLIEKAEYQLKSDDDRSTFNLLRNLMKKCCDEDPYLRPSSKAVQQELSGDRTNDHLNCGDAQRDVRRPDRPKREDVLLPHILVVTNAPTDYFALTKVFHAQPATHSLEPQKQSSSSPVNKPQKDGVDAFASKRKAEAAPTMKNITRHKTAKRFAPKSNIRHISSESERPSTSKGIFSPKSSSRVEATSDEASYAPGPPTLLANKKKIEDFLEAYQKSLLNRNFEEANNSLATLRLFLAYDIKATGENIRLKAVKLQDEEKYLQSIALFDTAAALFARMKSSADNLERIQYCIQGMKQANEAMVEKNSSTKMIVKEHVIPLMRDWVREMKGASQVSEKWRCHAVSWGLSNIEGCELMVGQIDERKQTLEEAVRRMREVFGSDVYKQQGRLFGNLVDHLAGVYNDELRFEEANHLYEEALKAHEVAEDYFGDDNDRKDDIRITTNNLRKNLKDNWKNQMRM